jgi:cell wall-associated NlpC family hydrolase
MKAAEVIAIARETIGTPYRHQGRVNGVALDCAGVPVHIAQRLSITLTPYTQYGRTPVPLEMRAALDAHLTRVAKTDLQLADVVWIRFSREPQHLGIVADYPLGGFSLIHAYNGAGLNKVVEHRLDLQWLSRIVAAWRYPRVEQ